MIIQTKGDVIRLKGSLVENQWPAIRSAVALLLDGYPRGVIVDASGLTDISEAGARTFLDASSFIQAHNARVVVAGLPEQLLEEIRKIPGVRSQLAVTVSIDEARASLESGGTYTPPARNVGAAILVPLIGSWQKALEYAVNQSVASRAEIQLLHIIQVPRNLPLGVPVPELERAAQQSLDEAEKACKRRGVKIRKFATRARDVVEGAAKFATETGPKVVIVAYPKSDFVRELSRMSVLSAFCNEIPGDLVILCVG